MLVRPGEETLFPRWGRCSNDIPSFNLGLAQSQLLGAYELSKSGSDNSEMPALSAQQTHPFELVELGCNGLPSGPDQVRQIFMSQAQSDQDPGGSLFSIFLTQV
jgi:hypothetical protein